MTDAVKPIVGIVMGSNSDWEVMKIGRASCRERV